MDYWNTNNVDYKTMHNEDKSYDYIEILVEDSK